MHLLKFKSRSCQGFSLLYVQDSGYSLWQLHESSSGVAQNIGVIKEWKTCLCEQQMGSLTGAVFSAHCIFQNRARLPAGCSSRWYSKPLSSLPVMRLCQLEQEGFPNVILPSKAKKQKSWQKAVFHIFYSPGEIHLFFVSILCSVLLW